MKQTNSAKRYTPGQKVTVSLTRTMAEKLNSAQDETGVSGHQPLFEFVFHRSNPAVADQKQGAA